MPTRFGCFVGLCLLFGIGCAIFGIGKAAYTVVDQQVIGPRSHDKQITVVSAQETCESDNSKCITEVKDAEGGRYFLFAKDDRHYRDHVDTIKANIKKPVYVEVKQVKQNWMTQITDVEPAN